MGHWYVVRTRAGKQKKATVELNDNGITVYCPMMRRETRHFQSKKWLMKECPLFTGYLFAYLRISDFGTLREMRNVTSVLADAGGTPIPVAGNIVEDMRDAQERGDFDVLRPPVRRLRVGDTVQVKGGPLSGHYASVTNVKGKRAIKAFVEMFGSLREVEIGLESIRRVA
ncbi:transcription termination/antitermination NusG family protein [Sinorhizobium meliloti]|uniref:transcription termination/antitermination NusG family protein n=1 Tax=Rhizobium meliloti TaxID=382 RepID=UPI0012A88E2F|nr:transcription termination/antitermination NusG family protein [Sinorhizobium meliloti]QGJ73798.1 hypothetical protein C3L21_07100 [Sinorhizobium meliloti]